MRHDRGACGAWGPGHWHCRRVCPRAVGEERVARHPRGEAPGQSQERRRFRHRVREQARATRTRDRGGAPDGRQPHLGDQRARRTGSHGGVSGRHRRTHHDRARGAGLPAHGGRDLLVQAHRRERRRHHLHARPAPGTSPAHRDALQRRRTRDGCLGYGHIHHLSRLRER